MAEQGGACGEKTETKPRMHFLCGRPALAPALASTLASTLRAVQPCTQSGTTAPFAMALARSSSENTVAYSPLPIWTIVPRAHL